MKKEYRISVKDSGYRKNRPVLSIKAHSKGYALAVARKLFGLKDAYLISEKDIRYNS